MTAKIKGGYILQPRIIDQSGIMDMPPVTRELWSYLLRKVRWKPHNGLRRGQEYFRLNEVQEDLCWYAGFRKITYSKPQLTKSLRRLREGNMIETMKATQGILITICNYEFYQDKKNYEGNDEKLTKEPRRKRKGSNIFKEGEEGKKENIGDKPKKRFTPPTQKEVEDYISEKKYTVNAAVFVSFYESKNWYIGKNKMKSWKAAVKTWQIKNDQREKPELSV
jgi:hypothetical protein